ncbi:MAG: 50S ribosomal protein L6 [Christensenellales bacterium]|mgnify:CR=1 FL=1|jgi:large subunit ribosomal protein L6|nr:50S ribosomal protein L6 [Clostridiales bacterium]
MSRIGRLPIKITSDVKVDIDKDIVTITGPLGTLSQNIANDKIQVKVENNEIVLTRLTESKPVKAAHGLYRSLIANMVEGVTKGFQKNLIISGVGFRAVAQGDKVVLNIGYSHTVDIIAPKGIKIEIVSPTELAVKGIDKVLVGQVAANIKASRKPDPYHGYGIRYKDETILRKEGKAAGK